MLIRSFWERHQTYNNKHSFHWEVCSCPSSPAASAARWGEPPRKGVCNCSERLPGLAVPYLHVLLTSLQGYSPKLQSRASPGAFSVQGCGARGDMAPKWHQKRICQGEAVMGQSRDVSCPAGHPGPVSSQHSHSGFSRPPCSPAGAG